MKNFLVSCMDQTDELYKDYIQMFLDEAENYEKGLKVLNVLSDVEKEYLKFMLSCYINSGQTPSLTLFCGNFPETKDALESPSVQTIDSSDLRVYMFQLIDHRVNNYIHDRVNQLNVLVRKDGITPEIATEFERLQKISNRNKAKDISLDIDSKAVYEEKKMKPLGLITGIKEIDEKIGGMNAGTVTTIAGFTSQYKTTFALNIARINAYVNKYNIVYISLETPKEDMNWNLLSSHSYSVHLSKYNYISHYIMRQEKLLPEEEDYLFNVVEKDLKEPYIDTDGNAHQRGKIVILDESDFDNFSFGEIATTLEKVDDQLKDETGFGIDAVIIDYIQLCKFSGSGMTYDANAQINSYVTFFRRLAQNFRKEKDANGKEVVRMLTMILLSQINRDNWRRARNNEGRYDITCLADANELERGSYRVFTTYTNEEMKGRSAAQVQILKNRTGQTMYEPAPVYADGAAYIFQDEDGMTQTFGGDATATLESSFSELDDSMLDDMLM